MSFVGASCAMLCTTESTSASSREWLCRHEIALSNRTVVSCASVTVTAGCRLCGGSAWPGGGCRPPGRDAAANGSLLFSAADDGALCKERRAR